MSFDTLVDRQGRPLSQVWPAVQQFQDVQDILDRNRVLIAEINHNQQLGTNVALERNVPMLKELNTNIARVVELYQGAADSFVTTLFSPNEGDAEHQHVLPLQQQLQQAHAQPQPQQQQQQHIQQQQQQEQQQHVHAPWQQQFAPPQ